MPVNTDFLNFHDIVLIMAIAVIMHIFVQPLYDRIDGKANVNT